MDTPAGGCEPIKGREHTEGKVGGQIIVLSMHFEVLRTIMNPAKIFRLHSQKLAVPGDEYSWDHISSPKNNILVQTLKSELKQW